MANTLTAHPPEKLVTYHGLGVAPLDPVTHHRFAQLDHILIPHSWIPSIVTVFSDRSAALSTHHFLQIAELDIQISKRQASKHKATKNIDTGCLRDPSVSESFVNAFSAEYSQRKRDGNTHGDNTNDNAHRSRDLTTFRDNTHAIETNNDA